MKLSDGSILAVSVPTDALIPALRQLVEGKNPKRITFIVAEIEGAFTVTMLDMSNRAGDAMMLGGRRELPPLDPRRN